MSVDLVQNENREEKGTKLEVMGSMQIKESRESLREKSLAMEIGESRDGHGLSEALAMEIGGGSTIGSGYGSLGDRWWMFWLQWFSRLVVDRLVKSWICSSLSIPLYPSLLLCLYLRAATCVFESVGFLKFKVNHVYKCSS